MSSGTAFLVATLRNPVDRVPRQAQRKPPERPSTPETPPKTARKPINPPKRAPARPRRGTLRRGGGDAHPGPLCAKTSGWSHGSEPARGWRREQGRYSDFIEGEEHGKERSRMSTRQGKRYTTSYKEREHPKQDPYAILKASRSDGAFHDAGRGVDRRQDPRHESPTSRAVSRC